MAITAETHPTLLDITSRMSPDGSMREIVELLSQQNEMIMDMMVMESNEPKSHQIQLRTGLPTGAWRGYNIGVGSSKSTTVNARANIGNYETWAVVDRDLADLNGNSAQWRLQEESAFLEHMTQTMQKQIIFGNELEDPDAFSGLATHYSTAPTNSSATASADNVIDAGGTGTDNASIYLVCWDPMCTFGIYPKGQSGGLKVEDEGEVTLENVPAVGGGTGNMKAYRTHYKWQLGIVVKDWRYNTRICNIDKSLLTPDASAGARLTRFMFEAMELIPADRGRMAFYMPRDIRTRLFQQLAEGVKSSTLTIEQVGGVRTHMFHGIPIRRVDAMAADEARVV